MWDCGVCWGKLGIVSESGKGGACNLMEIVGAPASDGGIWSGLGSVGTNHSAGAGAVEAGRKFDPGAIHVGDIWPKANVCWGNLVRSGVGSGYLVGIHVG